MGLCGSKEKKKKKPGEADGDGKCVLTPNMMKLVTLMTLLVSDFDVVLTLASIVSYIYAEGVFILFIIIIGFFFCIYVGGCIIAARESGKFMDRFKDKVRLNEINGISMEDLTDALDGRRIFWMGPEYEAAKKRKASIEVLKTTTPDATGPEEIDVQALQIALREAEMAGTAQLKMPGDPKYGAKAVKRATDKLIQAKKVQSAKPSLGRRASSRIQRGLGGPSIDDVPESVAEPNYKPNAPKTRDQMEGRADPAHQPIDLEAVGGDDDDNPEEDFAARMFEEEIAAAEGIGDANLVKMLQLASIKQLDSYRVDKKLTDKKGKITDPLRVLYMICEAKGILHSYHQASRSFSRRIVKPSHSIPYYRLMEYGWQPSVSHTDFAGILNANALYSFTVGIPQFLFSIVFIVSGIVSPTTRVPAPCETDDSTKCGLIEDFQRPSVQNVIIAASFFIGSISIIISIANIVIDFPAQLFDIAEKEEESLHFTLQAEHATKTWEDKLQVEVQENVKMMLKMSTQFENNSIPGMEAPGLVIEDVMKLERRAMEKKVAYIEHFLTMSEDEKKVRNDLRDGKRKKKEDPEEDFEDEEPPPPLPPPRSATRLTTRVPSAQSLPPPKQPSAITYEPVAEPTPLSTRMPSSVPPTIPESPTSPAAAAAAASASSLGAGAIEAAASSSSLGADATDEAASAEPAP